MKDMNLKPCPFCGGNDITVDTFKVKNDRWQSGVVCSSCLGGIDTLNTYLTPEESKALAIEAWNRRVEPSRPRGHWEMVSQHETPPTYVYSCSECSHKTFGFYNFCPSCGADMRQQEGGGA